MKVVHFLFVLLFYCTNLGGQFASLDILEGRRSIEIPFEYIQGFIIVKVKLNNLLALDFLFDTGAENSILLETNYADLMGLKYEDSIRIIGSDKEDVKIGRIIRRVPMSMVKGGVFTTDIVAMEESSLDFRNIVGRDISGIIGGNVLIGAVMEIDYRSQKIIFHSPNKFRAPRRFDKNKIEIINQRPFIKTGISVSGEERVDSLKFLLDTGAGLHILIDEASHPALAMPDSVIDGRIGYGLGGRIGGYLGNVHEISMLEDSFYNVKVYYQEQEEEIISQYFHNHRNGIFGNKYWERKRLIIDYPRQMIYTKELRKKKRDFRFNKSGMVVFAVGLDFSQFLVKHVVSNSPASEAGVRAGDVITLFNGYPSSLLNLDYINRRLSGEANKRIKIRVRRAKERIGVEFRLRELEYVAK